MIRFRKKFLFLKVTEIWFGHTFSLSDIFGLTGYFHVKEYNGKIWGVPAKSFTIENNISQSDDHIFAGFQKTVKTEIKQAEKLNVTCAFQKDLAGFVDFYSEFAKARGLTPVSEKRLREMGECLEISYATYEGIAIVAHSYLVDYNAGIARLLHSASKRLDEKFDKQLTGRANKLLHYRDMLYFREKGIKTYDFGGFADNTTDKGLQGINNFKLSFGGEKVECANFSSYPYFIFKKIAGAFGLLGKE